jgi:hypothetical protein
MTIAFVNRHPLRPARLPEKITGHGDWTATGAQVLAGKNPLESSTLDTPSRLVPREIELPAIRQGHVTCPLPVASLTVITLSSGWADGEPRWLGDRCGV